MSSPLPAKSVCFQFRELFEEKSDKAIPGQFRQSISTGATEADLLCSSQFLKLLVTWMIAPSTATAAAGGSASTCTAATTSTTRPWRRCPATQTSSARWDRIVISISVVNVIFSGHADGFSLLLRHPGWSDGLEGGERGLG